MKRGEKDIEGVTNVERPNRLGVKRRNKIIKTFALDKKKDDVRKYVVRREIKRKDKTFYKSPKIQRLITETRLRRKRQHKAEVVGRNKATRDGLEKYEKLLSQYAKEKNTQPRDCAQKNTYCSARRCLNSLMAPRLDSGCAISLIHLDGAVQSSGR